MRSRLERRRMSEVHLSRLVLDPRNRDVRRDLANCHALHQTLLRALPTASNGDARAEFGLLYRPEVDPRTGVVTVLVQSVPAPDWTRLPAPREGRSYLLAGADAERNPDCKRVGDVYSAIEAGQALSFRLRANPTKRLGERRHEPGRDRLAGKRVALLREEEQRDWLSRKALEAGFALVDVRVRPDRAFGAEQTGWRPMAAGDGDERRARLTFGAAVFDGVLRVTDAARFRAALAAGIGPGKAYGFGLLSVAPVRG